ncbi:MAG: hypothetical protein Q9159_005610 [Coniocarpon cinnabarinum]
MHAALSEHGPLPNAEEGTAPSNPPAHFHQQLDTARMIREALVKSTAILGLPLTINSLLSLSRATPPSLLDPPLSPSPTSRSVELSVPSSQILHRGSHFFAQTYGKVAARVMGQMDRCGTEDLGLTARLMYGYLLSNESVLGKKATSFCLIAGLVPLDVGPQLKGHLRGASNNGASLEEVRAVRGAVVEVCQAAGMREVSAGEMDRRGWRAEVESI